MVVLAVIALASGGVLWAVAACPLGRAIAISARQNAARRDSPSAN